MKKAKRISKTVKIPQAQLFEESAKGGWVSRVRAPWPARVVHDDAAWMQGVLASAESRVLTDIQSGEVQS